MSSFRTNNRFEVLMEDPKEKINKNNKNNNSQNIKNNNNLVENKQRNVFRRRLSADDKIKNAKEEEIKNITNINNFPELKSLDKKKTKNKSISNPNTSYYCDKLLNICVDENLLNHRNIEQDYGLENGCISIEIDKNNNFIWKYSKKSNIYGDLKKDDESNEKKEAFESISRVNSLYKKRRNDYITKWGWDEYEKMFIFPNYDYEYFDKKENDFNFDYNSDDNSCDKFYDN